ncbi:unnamed protein product, partial [Discosporangium mesarthrocarpum]
AALFLPRHLTEAAIVRTMKARKSLRHNELVAEVRKAPEPSSAPKAPILP